MLQRLSIRNYAIIHELEISFPAGLNIITGETGAGKSIIMGALGLVLGERADSSALVNKEKKCVIEAWFEQGKRKEIKKFLEENDFDISDELTVRREIAVNGKSRAFINDTPVTLSQLTMLGTILVDLHQQFDTLSLGESDFQREVIDALANQQEAVSQYQASYRNWQQVNRKLELLKEQKSQIEKEADYNNFQFAELEEAGFRENELEEIDADLKMLSNSEGIKTALDKVNFELSESETPLVQQIRSLVNQLSAFSAYHPDLEELLGRLQAAQVELKDISGEVDRISRNISYDPGKIEQLNERLSLGYKLQKKHGVNTTNELRTVHSQLAEKLQAVLNIDAEIEQSEKEVSHLNSIAREIALKISNARKKQVKPLEDKVNKLLVQVGMPNAKLQVSISATEPGPAGMDIIEFLFDANKSGQFQPVRKVASGGELSRLMLCIKSLVARSIDLPTLIFDEIDTGISGEAARQVGMILKELAMQRQVICITHQPQIAGRGDTHFFVYKEIVKDAVSTGVRILNTEERIIAIAKMLSGEKPTAAAMENAREMVGN